jgi:hypothetical protein
VMKLETVRTWLIWHTRSCNSCAIRGSNVKAAVCSRSNRGRVVKGATARRWLNCRPDAGGTRLCQARLRSGPGNRDTVDPLPVLLIGRPVEGRSPGRDPSCSTSPSRPSRASIAQATALRLHATRPRRRTRAVVPHRPHRHRGAQ